MSITVHICADIQCCRCKEVFKLTARIVTVRTSTLRFTCKLTLCLVQGIVQQVVAASRRLLGLLATFQVHHACPCLLHHCHCHCSHHCCPHCCYCPGSAVTWQMCKQHDCRT